MSKKGLGSNPLDNIIKDTTTQEMPSPETNIKSIKDLKFKPLKDLKYNTYEKLLVSMRPEQVEFLERLSKKIMRGRSSDYKEKRITKNTILRIAIDVLKTMEEKIDTTNIPNESVLRERINDLFQTTQEL